LNEVSETSSVIKGSKENVAIVVVIVTLVFPVVFPMVLGLPVAVSVFSVAVLMVSGLM